MPHKRTIKLEFEYVSKPYIEPKTAAKCYESYIRPIEDHDFWAHIFKDLTKPIPVMRSLCEAGTEEDTMSLIAMNFRDLALRKAAELDLNVQLSEQAYFVKSNGTKQWNKVIGKARYFYAALDGNRALLKSAEPALPCILRHDYFL
jgi:hypothetical protein